MPISKKSSTWTYSFDHIIANHPQFTPYRIPPRCVIRASTWEFLGVSDGGMWYVSFWRLQTQMANCSVQMIFDALRKEKSISLIPFLATISHGILQGCLHPISSITAPLPDVNFPIRATRWPSIHQQQPLLPPSQIVFLQFSSDITRDILIRPVSYFSYRLPRATGIWSALWSNRTCIILPYSLTNIG